MGGSKVERKNEDRGKSGNRWSPLGPSPAVLNTLHTELQKASQVG